MANGTRKKEGNIMKNKEWLKKMRAKFNITQKQLSDESGVNKLTIENLEQGKRKGSEETWKLIEDYFEKREKGIIDISMDSEDLIQELQEDIEEFGEDHPCILVYKYKNGIFLFTNYDFITDEMPFNPDKELREGEYYIETTFKYALEVFEKQNKII